MADVFVSYSRRDKEFAHILHDALENSHQKTWVDWKDILPTSEWWKEIERAIEGANTFIFVISPDSIISEYCVKEIEHADRLNKRILPIVRRDVMGSEGDVHPALSRHQWIFFRESDDFDIAFQRLIAAIVIDIAHIHGHTRLLVREREWNNNGREESFLLRGKELELAKTWLSESADKDPKPTESQVTYIEISRKVEDATKQVTSILQKGIERMKVISLAVSLLTLVGSCGTVLLIYQSTQSAIADAKNELVNVKKETDEKIANAQKEADKRIVNANKEAEKNISKIRIEARNYNPDLSILQPFDKDESPSKNATVYIQVPSDSIKNKLQNENLRSKLESNGYKAPGIEIVGREISPNENQIRYFVRDQEDRAKKLQNDLKSLNNPSYQNFKVTYVKGLEKKVKSKMLEIWFGKDAK